MTEEERAEWEKEYAEHLRKEWDEIRKTVKFEWWMDDSVMRTLVYAILERRRYLREGGIGKSITGEIIPGTTLPPGTDIADVSEEEMKRRTDKFWTVHLEYSDKLHAYYAGTTSEPPQFPSEHEEPKPCKRWQLLDVILGLWRD